MLNEQIRKVQLREAPFQLESGESLPQVEIAFHTYGTLNADKSNAIVVCNAILSRPALHEWLRGLAGDGRLLDTNTYFIISANLLGSCFGSTGPESIDPRTDAPYLGAFPEISVRDIARTTLGLLDELDISTAALAIGGSMGGMIVFEMAALAPHRFRAIAPLAVGYTQTAWAIAICSILLRTIIAHDPTLRDREKLLQGFRVATQLGLVICRSRTELESRFGHQRDGSKFHVEDFLDQFGGRIAELFSPYSYLTLTRAMQLYNLEHGRGPIAEIAKSIDMPALFVGCATDALYDPSDIERCAALFPQGEYHTLFGDFGHDSFLTDAKGLTAIVVPFLKKLELAGKGTAQ